MSSGSDFYGTFDDYDTAQKWCQKNAPLLGGDWDVMVLNPLEPIPLYHGGVFTHE